MYLFGKQERNAQWQIFEQPLSSICSEVRNRRKLIFSNTFIHIFKIRLKHLLRCTLIKRLAVCGSVNNWLKPLNYARDLSQICNNPGPASGDNTAGNTMRFILLFNSSQFPRDAQIFIQINRRRTVAIADRHHRRRRRCYFTPEISRSVRAAF